ncbi:MAG TPA: hypothetical protein VNB06_01270 [Thermoanaerobaculia bacterium]|nr:hypothetical protein [Thermoanaerobaculia bacterium]
MVELIQDSLRFRFPEVYPGAELTLDCQRTLRIPDDGRSYALPPGLGRFPVRHVDDFAARLPESWRRRGGVMLPMYQAEALWLCFRSAEVASRETSYPFAVKIAAGKINAVNGESWRDGLDFDPQGYVVVPRQPWLDGFVVGEGTIRQFVAMPLGAGYSAEEQLAGEAEWGGMQVEVFPMKREVFERRFPVRRRRSLVSEDLLCMSPPPAAADFHIDMALAPGGKMQQQIEIDPYEPADWDLACGQRCFVHLANSMVWRAITGAEPPHAPLTAEEYTRAGLPWFDWYSEQPAVPGSEKLAGLSSVHELGQHKGELPLPENQSVEPKKVVALGPAKRRRSLVRVGSW